MLYYYDKEDNSLNKLSKINGLSDINISSIKYLKSVNTLIIGYENGNIDLLQGDVITNMSDIKRNTTIIGSKAVNDIFLLDNTAYLACGFGIVVLDLNKTEIKETYLIGSNRNENVAQVFIEGNDICLGTDFDDGISIDDRRGAINR